MSYKQIEIEKILKRDLIINSNTDSFYNCYYKCADKKRIIELYEQKNHEIIYGRRGTGKTTLFKALYYYVNNGIVEEDSIYRCIYIDMEDVLPNNNEIKKEDTQIIIIETYRNFLIKFVNQLLEFWLILSSTNSYYEIVYTDDEIATISKKLEVLLDLIVYGEKVTNKSNGIEKTNESSEKTRNSILSANIEFQNKSVKSILSKALFEKNNKRKKIKEISIQKEFIYTLNISSIKNALDDLLPAFKLDGLILCIDEFTRVDKGLDETIQPYIAQLIKDTFFRNYNISVKVSSLWNQNHTQMRQLLDKRVGVELGEDIKRGIDLDTMFFGNDRSYSFFENMIFNTFLLHQDTLKNEIDDNSDVNKRLKKFLIKSLFADDESFKLLICGSQGVPRVFGNLLIAAIDKRIECQKIKIDAQIVYECIIENSNRDVRTKLPYDNETVCAFDDFITKNKIRFILVSISDYKKHQEEIDGLLSNNYMHQYPSERIDRRIRNRYKVYLIHLGNYLEAIGIKDWRKNISTYTILYPNIPEELLKDPKKFQLTL